MAILRTHDDFIWLDVTERCINDEKTTTEIWLAHDLYAVDYELNDQSEFQLESYEELVKAMDDGFLIGIPVGFLPKVGTIGDHPDKELRLGSCLPLNDKGIVDDNKPLTEPEVDLTSFSWDDFTNLNK
tara:strand:- start:876 stop:1259 length:384 start_codon:yes stop_codon:yes gene_type:complete